jgi:hypothetical protein
MKNEDEDNFFYRNEYIRPSTIKGTLFLNYRRNEDEANYLLLNYRRNEDEEKYLLLNYRRNEDEEKYLLLNYRRNEDEAKYLFLNYLRNKDEAKYSIRSSTIDDLPLLIAMSLNLISPTFANTHQNDLWRKI